MAINLRRLFTSIIELSEPPRVSLSYGRPEFCCSTSRLIYSSTQREQTHQENPNKQEGQVLDHQEKLGSEEEDVSNGDVEDADDEDVNKETGEIGGPRGPEPTRFGDWERNGRCSDF
ncbi:unnamed protein product [Ilex paraguariensis]|uniref:Succinate dehydrogenase assembly factor 4, mitochondrial n=1 Tax=Ilex paraguariensis TaxID=185542 RepID=A0ABC8RU96_9AQUA